MRPNSARCGCRMTSCRWCRHWSGFPRRRIRLALTPGLPSSEDVFEDLAALHPTAVVVDPQLRKADAIAMTVQAMNEGAPLVLGGWLPDDVEGGRKGRPDILINGRPRLPSRRRQAPPHPETERRLSARSCRRSHHPMTRLEAMGWTATAHRYEDGLQLGHYTRMLQACGSTPDPSSCGARLLGTTQLEVTPGQDPELVFAWHNLAEPLFFTFSRSQRQDEEVTAGAVRPRTRLPRQGGRQCPAYHRWR